MEGNKNSDARTVSVSTRNATVFAIGRTHPVSQHNRQGQDHAGRREREDRDRDERARQISRNCDRDRDATHEQADVTDALADCNATRNSVASKRDRIATDQFVRVGRRGRCHWESLPDPNDSHRFGSVHPWQKRCGSVTAFWTARVITPMSWE